MPASLPALAVRIAIFGVAAGVSAGGGAHPSAGLLAASVGGGSGAAPADRLGPAGGAEFSGRHWRGAVPLEVLEQERAVSRRRV